MDQDDHISPEYLKRFNDGYLIAKHMPELANQLKNASKDLGDGFRNGIDQFEKDAQSPLPAWLRTDRLSNLDKDRDLDMDLEKD